MNSPEVSHGRPEARGFTLVEVLLVIALVLIFGALLFPSGMASYQAQLLNQTRSGVENALREAQSSALSGKHDSAFGVMITGGAYTIFEGEEYGSRVEAEDETFPIPEAVSFSGIDAVTFAKMSGEPSVTGAITVSTGARVATIQILPGGTIE